MALPRQRMTPDEYLALERGSDSRHEYFNGETYAMSGASRRHSLIATSISASLFQQTQERPCEVHGSDMRVKVSATGLYTYPDVTIVCGTPELEDSHLDTLLNPTVLIEVLSPSTEAYDRGKKFEHYQRIASLQEYLLVAQDEPRIEQFIRQPQGWAYREAAGLDAEIALPTIGCTLSLKEVYQKVSFDMDSAGSLREG
ncbi:MAG: Uma2 family endonuclease [Anaerolineae bacterium]|nr:Uma2 family endonuclease [Anaerolineae bacterium]